MENHTLTHETWKPIPGFNGYEASDRGRVRSVPRVVSRSGRPLRLTGRTLRPKTDRDGYQLVELCTGGVATTEKVHRLVLVAFVGPCPIGMMTLHHDDNPANNVLGNLRWGTRSENYADSVRNGREPRPRRTRCPQGHVFDEANTAFNRNGSQYCRTCKRDRTRANRNRIAEAMV